MVQGGLLASIEEHQESRAPGTLPDCRNAFRQSALGSPDRSYVPGSLRQMHIKHCQPILKRLECKTAEYEHNPERPETPFRKIVSIVFNVGIHRHSDASNKSCHQPYANGKCPSVFHAMNEGAADQGTGNRADQGSPELTTCKPRMASRHIIYGWAHAARVRKNLANCDEKGKRDCESKSHNPI